MSIRHRFTQSLRMRSSEAILYVEKNFSLPFCWVFLDVLYILTLKNAHLFVQLVFPFTGKLTSSIVG